MKTLSDYHKKVLGISLNGKVPENSKSKTEGLEHLAAGPFCFLCSEDDFKLNKDLVLKILKAAGADQSIVFFENQKTSGYREVFSFGSSKEKALSFESFSDISKSPELKKKLWTELKKRTLA